VELGQIEDLENIEDENVEILLEIKIGSENIIIRKAKNILIIKNIEDFNLNENCSLEAIEAT